MNVRKEDSPVEPTYPDAKEFLKHKAALSAALLSAGMALGSCAPSPRMVGAPPATSKDMKEACVETQNDEPMRSGGDFPVEPKADPPRLPGKARVEPPRLGGTMKLDPSKVAH